MTTSDKPISVPFKTLLYDISGRCNAKCPYCVASREPSHAKAYFVKADEFERTLDWLLARGLIDRSTEVTPYITGEPTLNPELGKIAEIVAEKKMYYVLSSNASTVLALPPRSLAGLRAVTFSMPGFSQESYDRIHGFRFDRIIQNITQSMAHLEESARAIGCPPPPVYCSFHLYQFNIHEIRDAARFCRRLGLIFQPSEAYFASVPDAIAYLRQELPKDLIYRTSRELMLHSLDGQLAHWPTLDYQCPQWDKLNVDEHGNVLTCCAGFPKNHPDSIVGPLFDMPVEELLRRKRSMPICKACTSTGAAYWMHHRQHMPLYAKAILETDDWVALLKRRLPPGLKRFAKACLLR